MKRRQTNKQKEEKKPEQQYQNSSLYECADQVLSHKPSDSPTLVTAFKKDKKDQLLSNRRAVMGQWKDLDFGDFHLCPGWFIHEATNLSIFSKF